MHTIERYEHGRLLIGEEGFTRTHWEACVRLNQLHEGKYFELLPQGIKFNQYVGVLQVGGLLLQIHPKAGKADDSKRWKGVLLEMLKACGRLKAQTPGSARVKKQNLNLLEVYFEFFLREVEYLIHRGLIKRYRKHTANVSALKGKLEFAGNIRQNIVHKERFYTSHQVYDYQHKLHQILAFALKIVDHFCSTTYLNDLCKRVFLAFPEMENIKVNAALLNNITIDRKSAPYERALELARFIILSYSPDISHGNKKMIALLFDMNQLWEEYIFRHLKKYILKHPELGLSIRAQESRLFYGSSRYLCPDIVLRKKDENNTQTIVIDTKWKNPGSYSAMEDLRQLYTYARFWQAEKVILLYPGNQPETSFIPYQNHSVDILHHRCKAAFVNVVDEEGRLRGDVGERVFESIAHL